MPNRHASCHSKNIPETRPDMISRFPTPAIATVRRIRSSTQARVHATSDHEQKNANRAVDLTTGKRAVSMESLFDVPPLRHRACEKQSRPSAFAVHHCIPHAPPPVAGHRRRSQRNIGLRHMAHATRAPRFSPKGFARDPYGFRLRMVAA